MYFKHKCCKQSGKNGKLTETQKLSQRKLAGAATYRSTYEKELEEKYPISPGQAPYEFRYKVCLCDVGCSPQGEADEKRHCEGATHVKRWKAMENTYSLDMFEFTKASDPIRKQVSHICSDEILLMLKFFKCVLMSVSILPYTRVECKQGWKLITYRTHIDLNVSMNQSK